MDDQQAKHGAALIARPSWRGALVLMEQEHPTREVLAFLRSCDGEQAWPRAAFMLARRWQARCLRVDDRLTVQDVARRLGLSLDSARLILREAGAAGPLGAP